MERWLGRLAEPAYAAFRIVVGVLFLQHGAQKLFGVLGGMPPNGEAARFGDHPQVWIGGLIEFVCGVLVAVGCLTGWAAFLASGTMAVAYFQFHQPQGTLPLQNGGELAVVYCFAFLVLATKGSGIWSVSCRRAKA